MCLYYTFALAKHGHYLFYIHRSPKKSSVSPSSHAQNMCEFLLNAKVWYWRMLPLTSIDFFVHVHVNPCFFTTFRISCFEFIRRRRKNGEEIFIFGENCPFIEGHNKINPHVYQMSTGEKKNVTHCSFSNLHCGSSSKRESCFTPESPGLLKDKSSSLMCEGFDLRAEARSAQPSSLIQQLDNLQWN